MSSISQNTTVADLANIPQSAEDVHSVQDASRLLCYWRKKQQSAKIYKRWSVSQYRLAQERARQAKEDLRNYEHAVKISTEIIMAKGYKIIWESPKDGIYMPYVMKVEEDTGLSTVSVDGGDEKTYFLEG